MKKRYIDGLTDENNDDEEQEAVLRNLVQAHLNAENREKWTAQLADAGIKRPEKVFYRSRTFLAAATLLVLLSAGIWWWQSTQTPLALAREYVSQDGPLQFTTGFRGDRGTISRRNEAVAAYDAGRYDEAIRIFSTVESSDTTLKQDLLFMGLCRFYGENYTDAIPFLMQATAAEGKFDPQAGWFWALALIYNRDTKAAVPVLEQLSLQQGSAYAQRATLLLERIGR